MKNIRSDFVLLQSTNRRHRRLVYFDSASTSQKPRSVVAAETQWYQVYNANVHRAPYQLAEKATAAYESARSRVARFIDAPTPRSIIFTSGATAGLNTIASSWAESQLKKGDTILLSVMEHHANLVPWQQLAQRKKLAIRYWPLDQHGQLELKKIDQVLRGVKLLSLTHVSNVLGTINPLKQLIAQAHRRAICCVVDAAQSVGHMPVSVRQLQPDFLTFSGHKMLGPTGIGIIYVAPRRFDELKPFLTGGEMVATVTSTTATFKPVPWLLEAGTQPLAQIHGLVAAIEYLERHDLDKVKKHINNLTTYTYERLAKIKGVTIYGPPARSRLGVVSFNVFGIHPHDLATWLDQHAIAVRAGHHCAQPLHDHLGIPASIRVSFHLYNSRAEIDYFITTLRRIIQEWHHSINH